MQKRHGLVALFVLVGLVVPAFGQAKIEWKFTKGKTFYQEITTKTVQEMKISQQTINQTQTQTFYFSWKPTELDKKTKTWKVLQKIEGVKLDIEIGGNKVSYDSSKEQTQSNPLAEFFKQLVDSEFTLTVDKNFKITKIDGKEKFIDKLTKSNAQMEPLLKEILNDEAFKQMVDPTFSALPTAAELKKKEWKRESNLNMGPIGKYKTTYTYTYDGTDASKKELVRIKVATVVKYTKPDAKTASQLPFKIEKADLEPTKKSSGVVVFNTKEGRIASSRMELELRGKLTIAIGGMNTDVDLTQTQTTTVTTSDSPQIKKP